jgi:endonuclease YncB( thermonuclease family)
MNFLISSNEVLNNYNIHNTPKFSLNLLFKDELVKARVVNIYDGDTITCILPINNKYYNFKIRLAGIDTCEIKSKCEENKNLAIKAKKRLCQLIIPDFKIDDETNKELNKELDKILNEKCYIIKIKLGDFDLYGRVLGWLFDKDANIDTPIEQSFNNILINEHLAYSYQGKTKLTDSEQVELLN